MQLRWYQKQAVEAIWDYLRTKDGAPCVVLPTGSGKTPVIAELCRQVVAWGGRAVVLAHVKELLQQTVDKLSLFVDPEIVGVYSAGLNERTTDKPITVAGIQSIYQKADQLGEVQLIVIDEAHLIPPSGCGRYRQFLESEKIVSQKARLVGLTATPYRLGAGWITNDRVTPEQREYERGSYDRLLDAIVYEVPVHRLIADGTLSAVVSCNASKRPDFSGLHVVRGDFDESEIEKALTKKGVLESACAEIVEETKERHKVIVFCNRRESARKCAKLLREYAPDFDAEVVDGETAAGDRADLIRRFKSETGDETLIGETKPLKFICNVGVLTTGFDAPNIDAIALLRPTQSLTLYQQMVGRGLRTCPTKKDCLVLDFGGNVERHGPIDLPNPDTLVGITSESKPWKECPACRAVIARAYKVCPICGEFLNSHSTSDPNKNLTGTASNKAILSGQENGETVEDKVDDHTITGVEFEVHYKKDADADKPPTMQVKYLRGSFQRPIFEWLCVEHEGWARKRFEKWWKTKSKIDPPASVETAVAYAKAGALATPTLIRTTVKPGNRFPQIEWLEMSDLPDFDPASVKTFEEDFFSDEPETLNEFDQFEEKTSNSGYTCCASCCSWLGPEDYAQPGYCVRKKEERRYDDTPCEKFCEREDLKDCPF